MLGPLGLLAAALAGALLAWIGSPWYVVALPVSLFIGAWIVALALLTISPVFRSALARRVAERFGRKASRKFGNLD